MGVMLDLDPARTAAPPKPAATLVVVRDGRPGLEVFCVERQKVGFLGGAIVFPGGKMDEADLDRRWVDHATAPRPPATPMAADDDTYRALAVAACREALEEAAILPVVGTPLDHATRLAWRARTARRGKTEPPTDAATLLQLVTDAKVKVDLAALWPMSRWITPVAESRRFDTRFFLYAASAEQTGVHDDHETTASFWATPAEVLRRFVAGELQLAPPTHRTLETLVAAPDTRAALAMAAASCLEPICPSLVTHVDSVGQTMALVLPGDPEHDVRESRSPGASRYVLRGDRFLPGEAPAR
jgi:8-oxo-dGTP pyrophosphatase MutT (NUDIX family)